MNDSGNLLAAKIYASPNDAGKTHLESKKLKGKTIMKLDDTTATVENIKLKRETTGKTRVN